MQASIAFRASTVTATFDETVERDAAAGRIPHALLLAVSADYGIELSASPREFIVTLNRDYLAGSGLARLAPLVQVLHGVANVIIGAGTVKNLPALLALPVWAGDCHCSCCPCCQMQEN